MYMSDVGEIFIDKEKAPSKSIHLKQNMMRKYSRTLSRYIDEQVHVSTLYSWSCKLWGVAAWGYEPISIYYIL